MPILYLDEDVKRAVADLLLAPDRLVHTAREEGRLGASDPYQLLYAAEQGWIIVTCNRGDYHLLHEAWLLWSYRWGIRRDHPGILALDQGQPAGLMAAAIEQALASGGVLMNAMYDWTARDGQWRRYRP